MVFFLSVYIITHHFKLTLTNGQNTKTFLPSKPFWKRKVMVNLV